MSKEIIVDREGIFVWLGKVMLVLCIMICKQVGFQDLEIHVAIYINRLTL